MTWLDDLKNKAGEAAGAVVQVTRLITEPEKLPERTKKEATEIYHTATEYKEDVENFISENKDKAEDELSEEAKAIKAGLISTAAEITKKTTELVSSPEALQLRIPEIPEIKIPEIKLPEIPTPQDIINALTQCFKPLIEAINTLALPMNILKTFWVPVYDPFTGKTYNSADEYFKTLPVMLQKMGEASQKGMEYAEKIRKGAAP